MDRRLRADAGSSSCIRRARCKASESLRVNEIAEEYAVEEITRTRRRPATLAERIFRPLVAQSRIGWEEMEIRSGKSGARRACGAFERVDISRRNFCAGLSRGAFVMYALAFCRMLSAPIILVSTVIDRRYRRMFVW